MDPDQILDGWKRIRAKTKEALEKLRYEVLRDQRKTTDQNAATPRGTSHLKHFEDMH